MWRLRRIIAENLCAFRELDYYLYQGVTTLVFGDNKDNESQRSNGSGKSALLEAIAIGITGSAMRKIRNEEIIRDDADECFVCLTFDNDASDEVFTVKRQLQRKGASVISCRIERGGIPVDTDEAVQPTVDAYNKYILEKLGISREELYNNFLLSKYKYADFLSSSDKEKKEVINRFSAGDLVDQAIENLIEDYNPVQQEVRAAELDLAGIDGRIEILQEQIGAEENSHSERLHRRETQILEVERRISDKRTSIRECKERITKVNSITEELKVADTALQLLENGEGSLEECLKYITSEIIPLLGGGITDWSSILEDKKQKLKEAHTALQACEIKIGKSESALSTHKADYDRLAREFKEVEVKNRGQQAAYDRRLKELEEELETAGSRLNELKQERRKIISGIENLKNKLAGSISCPACGYEFLTAQRDFDVEAGKEELICLEKENERLAEDISKRNQSLGEIEVTEEEICRDKRHLNTSFRQWADRLSDEEKKVKDAMRELENIIRKRQQTLDQITSLQEETDGLRRKLFDEVFGLLDEAYKKVERQLKTLEEEIQTAENAIAAMQDTIRELQISSQEETVESLKKALKACRAKGSEILQRKMQSERRLQVLQEQEQRFIQFKTYLANGKIEALAQVTNGFLENIGSDIRIRFSGYTVLKTGKVREKISISLLRNGVDCGSFGKFSAGEAARVNLATILAMQKLVNGNCQGDKGLDLLVLDEILEAVDEEGLSSMFAALNTLGVTALVVSHGNVAEGYPHKLLIVKENGESKIDRAGSQP